MLQNKLKKIQALKDKKIAFQQHVSRVNQERQNKIQERLAKINSIINLKNKYGEESFRKLIELHRNLKLDFGTFLDEYPEQMMAVKYLTGYEKVLEIGGNIGRNSLIIAFLLNKNSNTNFVSMECDQGVSEQLVHNKNLNNLNFYVESSALSKRKLIQKGWDTITSDVLLDGYKNVNITDYEELKNKYGIKFDTLVLDCEGAFYYILMDMPEILEDINLIIMENDYYDISKKNYVDSILKDNGFYVDYSEAGGWGPCYNNFYEVWKKIVTEPSFQEINNEVLIEKEVVEEKVVEEEEVVEEEVIFD
jgi:FkbM family methyltransferase